MRRPPSTRSQLSLALVLLWSTASACATQGLRGPEWLDSRNAASYAEKHPESEVLAEANKLIRAVNTGELAPIEAWMSEEMRSHYRDGRLERVSEQIQRRYGRTLGIIEERVHREAGLTWSRERMSFVRESRRLDTTRMRELLGVVPDYANPEDGIRASLEEE